MATRPDSSADGNDEPDPPPVDDDGLDEEVDEGLDDEHADATTASEITNPTKGRARRRAGGDRRAERAMRGNA